MTTLRDWLSGMKGKLLLALSLLLLLLIMLPVMLQFSLRYWIDNSGLGQAHIADVDLNLFAGTLELENFELDQNREITLVIGRLLLNYGWFGHGLSEFELQELDLWDSRLVIHQDDQGDWNVIVPLTTTATTDGSGDNSGLETQEIELPKLFANQISFHNVEFELRSQTLNGILKIDSLDLQRLSTYSEEPSFLKIVGSWNGAPINVDLTAAFAGKNRTLKGEITLDRFKLTEFLPLIADQLKNLQGEAAAKLTVNAIRTPKGKYTVLLDGALDIKQLGLEYQQFAANLEAIQWQGSVAVDFLETLERFKHKADITGHSLTVMQRGKALEIAALEKLTLSGLLIDEQQTLQLEQLHFKQLDLFRPVKNKQGWLRTAALTIDKVSLSEFKQLDIAGVTIKGGQYLLATDADGQLHLETIINELMPASTDSEAAPAEPMEKEASPFNFSLGQFQMLDNSYVAFQDGQFTPAVTTRFTIDSLSMKALSSNKKDSKTLLSLAAHLDEFSKIRLDGWLKPFSSGRDLSLKGELEAIDLPPFSPYSEAAVGYHIATGHLDLNFDMEIRDEQMDMHNQLKLRHFEIEETDADKSESLSESMGVPLGLGLSLLRDSDDTIQMNVPIDGQLDAPDFDVNSLIAKSMGKALGNASVKLLKLAIQPYGVLVATGEFLDKQWDSLDLKPIVFESGSEQLTAAEMPYMDKLSGLLADKKDLRIKLCGVASVEDHTALSNMTAPASPIDDARLNSLAKDREVVVKRYLVEHGINGKRLTLCKPKINDEEFAGVRISL